MHPSVEQLLKVQAVDNEIRFLQDAMRLRPQELDSDRKKLERARDTVSRVAGEIKSMRMEVDKGEMEIKRCDGEIERNSIALNSAKTNEEYSVLQAQIEKIKDERSSLEEKVLEQLSALDALDARRREMEQLLADEQRGFDRKKADLEEMLRSMEEKHAELSRQRDELASGVNPEHLALYQKVLDRYRDSAISVVRDGVCQGCFMTVTPQHVNLLMIGAELIQCMNCGRLLYID